MMDTSSGSSCAACGPLWRLPLLLALVLAAILLTRGIGIRETTAPDPAADRFVGQSGETISLVIDFGEERRRKYEAVCWREGMTVRDALAAAVDSSSNVKFAQQGSGQSAFLTEIEGVKNEGVGGRNWTYTVNGKLGDRSFAVYPLRPGDQVLWTFAAPQ